MKSSLTPILAAVLLFAGLLALVACEPKDEPSSAGKVEVSLAGTSTRAELAAKAVRRDAFTAVKALDSAESKTPPAAKPLLLPDFNVIRIATTQQVANAAEVDQVQAELIEARRLTVETEKAGREKYEAMKAERDAAITEKDSSVRNLRISYCSIFGIVGALGAGVAVFAGESAFIRRIGVAIVTVGVAGSLYGVFLPAIANAADKSINILAIGVSVIALLSLVYVLWRNRKTLFKQDKAIVQLVDSVQRVRHYLGPAEDEKVFGVPAQNAYPEQPTAGLLDDVQDDETKAIVDEAQDALGVDKDVVAAEQSHPPLKVAA